MEAPSAKPASSRGASPLRRLAAKASRGTACPVAARTEVAPFLASLYRALQPGGTLILREYDAKILELIHFTHTLTRLVYGLEPPTSEPHFRPLADWIALAEAAGFKAHPPLFRRGDPTLQAMIKLEK